MKKLLSKIIDFIFPNSCPLCEERVDSHGMLCTECWGKFAWISDPKCAICGYPFPANIDLGDAPLCPTCASGGNELDWCRSACVYDEASRNAILPFKYANRVSYAKFMSRMMINAIPELKSREFRVESGDTSGAHLNSKLSTLNPVDVVIPVPLSYRRIWGRGYNQASLLAASIACHFNVPMITSAITRKHRNDMGHLSDRARERNIRGVFVVHRPELVHGKTILLVDDVMTSGNTFRELHRVLKNAGAFAVYGVSFCRRVRAI